MRFDSSRRIPSKVMSCLYEGRFAFLTILSGQHPHSILWDFQLPWFFFFLNLLSMHLCLLFLHPYLKKTRYHISLSKRLGLEHVLSQTQRLNVFQITWSPAMLTMKHDGLLLLSSMTVEQDCNMCCLQLLACQYSLSAVCSMFISTTSHVRNYELCWLSWLGFLYIYSLSMKDGRLSISQPWFGFLKEHFHFA